MEPISTALAGIALVQQSVEFIKKNIETVQDIGQIIDVVDKALDGQQHINRQRWGNKSALGQHKQAAHAVIDAKLAQEQIEEMKNLIDYRFGFGTWNEILQLRAQRIREEREEAERLARIRQKNKKELVQTAQIVGLTIVVAAGVMAGLVFAIKVF